MMHIRNEDSRHTNPLEGLVIVNIDYFKDERGFFIESWNKESFAEAGITDDFVQDSHSGSELWRSSRHALSGHVRADGKLVRCTVGRIFDVAIDLRMSSPTFGKWFGLELNAENKSLLYVPVGFAHGFATLSDHCEVQYKQTGFYNPTAEGGIAWNDPEVSIQWPIPTPILSTERSKAAQSRGIQQEPGFPMNRTFGRFIAR